MEREKDPTTYSKMEDGVLCGDIFTILFGCVDYREVLMLMRCSRLLLSLVNNPQVILTLRERFSIVTVPIVGYGDWWWFKEHYTAKYYPWRSLIPLRDLIMLAIFNNDPVAYMNTRKCLRYSTCALGDEITWMALCKSHAVFNTAVEHGISFDGIELTVKVDETTGKYQQETWAMAYGEEHALLLRYASISGLISGAGTEFHTLDGDIARGEGVDVVMEKMKKYSFSFAEIRCLAIFNNRPELLADDKDLDENDRSSLACSFPPVEILDRVGGMDALVKRFSYGEGFMDLGRLTVTYHVPPWYLDVFQKWWNERGLSPRQVTIITTWGINVGDVELLEWILPLHKGKIVVNRDIQHSNPYVTCKDLAVTVFNPIASVAEVLRRHNKMQ